MIINVLTRINVFANEVLCITADVHPHISRETFEVGALIDIRGLGFTWMPLCPCCWDTVGPFQRLSLRISGMNTNPHRFISVSKDDKSNRHLPIYNDKANNENNNLYVPLIFSLTVVHSLEKDILSCNKIVLLFLTPSPIFEITYKTRFLIVVYYNHSSLNIECLISILKLVFFIKFIGFNNAMIFINTMKISFKKIIRLWRR